MAKMQDIPRLVSDRARSTRRSPRWPRLVRAGLVVLMLGLIAFSVYQVARHITVGLNTLRTQEIVDETYVDLELFLFRDEQLLVAPGADVIRYDVADGERVGVGATMGVAYASGLEPGDAAALQASLNAYAARISLHREIGGLGTPADARRIAEAVDRYYLSLLHAAERGDAAAALSLSDRMLDGIGRYDLLTGGAGEESIASLEAARAALVAGYAEAATLRTERSGYFYYRADGYESAFPYASAMTMTPEEFRGMTDCPAAEPPEGLVGKLVYSPVWYAATYLPLGDPAIELFQAGIDRGAAYTMHCGGRSGVAIEMSIERLVPDAEGALVVFSSLAMPEGFDFSRSIRVETVALEVRGYRIPSEALVQKQPKEGGPEVYGVYILSGNVVEFRRVRIRVRRDGYVIAETYEDVEALLDAATDADRTALTAGGWSYLRLNDNILMGNELYEGKLIG